MKPSKAGAPHKGEDAQGERESGVLVAREARKYPRRRVLLSARVSTLQGTVDAEHHEPYFVLTDARTLDVADAGAGLRVDDPMPEGKRVVVELELPDGEIVLRLARVMWSASDSESYYVGLCFDEPLNGLLARL